MYFSSASSKILLYDINSWECKKSYGCYDGLLRDVSWSDDSKYLLQVNAKGLVEVLSAADHDVRSLQHVPLKDSWSASFHREGHRNIAIGTKSGNVMIWDTKNKNIIKTFPTPSHPSAVNHVSYNAKNTGLAATMHNGETTIYGLASNIPVLTVKLNCSKSISSMKFHHDSRSLLGLATDEGHVILRDITVNKDKAFFEDIHAAPVGDLAFSLNNKDLMFSAGYDKITNIYDIRLQSVIATIKAPYPLNTLAVNHENQLALGTKNGLVLVYDLRDMSNVFKILKGHEDEVIKVVFQPVKKKPISTEISLREDTENLSPFKNHSPIHSRTSDMFFITDSPVKPESPCRAGSAKADSFFVMLGLDKSSNNSDDDENYDGNKSIERERQSDRLDVRYTQLVTEKKISKASTPIAKKIDDNGTISPPIVNDAQDEGVMNFETKQITNQTDKFEELKDCVRMTAFHAAYDNRNYFLAILMALTKQKLYLEKQLASINEQMKVMADNQNMLIETNRRLVLEIEQLKGRQNLL